jgi:CelD/BcsL family acetyltransferase involved in cellulose biosynthesis
MGLDAIRSVVSRRWTDVPVDREQWNALVAESGGATIFQTYEWFASWWRAFGHRRELFLVTFWQDDRLAGIAPLMIERRAGLRHLEFVGSGNADYNDFILGRREEEILPLVARYLASQRDRWDLMTLRNVPTESPTAVILPAVMRSLGLGTTDHEHVACPTLQVSSRAAETRRLLDSYGFRRRIKQLRQHGELAFMRCSTAEQVNDHLPRFFAQYLERRGNSPAATAFAQPEVQGFYRALAAALLPRGWLHFSVLECGGQPAAYHFGFEFGGRLYWYKPCFDPALARQSPGTVLLWYLISDCRQRGLEEFDFTVGAEAFKYRYASSERVNATLRVFRHRWLYVAAMGIAWARRTAAQWRRRWRAASEVAARNGQAPN